MTTLIFDGPLPAGQWKNFEKTLKQIKGFEDHSFSFVSRTGSTNDDLKENWRGFPPPQRLLIASHQSHGRGRFERVWKDRVGHSLLFSFSWRFPIEFFAGPNCDDEDFFFPLPLFVGVALHKTLSEISGLKWKPWLKWPNDIWAGNSKLAGVLIETTCFEKSIFGIIGIGINFKKDSFFKRLNKISIEELGGEISAHNLLIDFLKNWTRTIEQQDLKKLHEEYLSRAEGFWGRMVEVEATDSRTTLTGRVEGISKNGRLILRLENGEKLLIRDAGQVKILEKKTGG